MSKRKYKRATIFICPNCGITFTSQEALSHHAHQNLQVNKDSDCLSSLCKCDFCGELWPNENSLSRHMLQNKKCKEIQNLNDHMTKLLPKEVVLLEEDGEEERAPVPSSFKDLSVHRKNGSVIHATIMGMDMSLKQMNGNKKNKSNECNTSYPKYVQQQSNGYLTQAIESSQVYTLTKADIDLAILENSEDYNDDLTVSAAKFCSTVLSMSERFANDMLKGTMKQCLIEIKNTATCIAMESGNDYLPGFEQTFHFSDLSDHIIMLFVLKHNTAALMEAQETFTTAEPEQIHTETGSDSEESNVNDDIDDIGGSYFDNEAVEANQNAPPTRNNNTRAIDESTNQQQENVEQTRSSSLFDTSDLAMIQLLDILAEAGAPVYLFDKLTSWCKRSSKAFCNEKLVSRESFLKTLSLKVYGKHMTKELRPKVVRHTLPSGKKIDVTAFSFKAKLASILMDDDLMQQQNLLLNRDNPFAPPHNDHGVLSDLNTGWWWRETWLETCTAGDEILCPIVLFLDAGRATKRVSVEPLTFTIGLLKRDMRNLSKAWRTLGYLENISNSESDAGTEASEVKTVAGKMDEYHSILALLLHELKMLQGRDGGLQWDLKLGGKTYRVVLKFAVQVILGDCKGNNVLCGQYGGHSLQSNRLCRDCMIAPSEADDPNHVCKFIGIEDVRGKSKKELNSMSMHKIQNAFEGVYFGARTSSIYNCTPPEPLHGLLLGTVKYLFEEFERTIPNSTMSLINQFAKAQSRLRSHEVSNGMPSFVSFRHGVTNCDTLTANQQYSRLFLIFLSLHEPDIFRSLCLQKRSRRVMDEGSHSFRIVDVDPIGHNEAIKWMSLIEDTLTFYQWLMKPRHSMNVLQPRHNLRRHPVTESQAMRHIRKYMHSYRHLIGDRPGHGLKITKFHQLLHYPRQILKDGSIKNVDTGVCEGMAVQMYKRLVPRTQRKEQTMNRELANRHLECLIIAEAKRLTSAYDLTNQKMPNQEARNSAMQHGSFKGTRYFISYPKNPHDNVEIQWKSKTKNIGFPFELCLMLTQRLFLNTGDGGCLMHHSTVQGFSEYDDGNSQIYRAHPNFRGNGAWNDWCLVSWEGIDEYVPAKLITFLDLTECDFMTNQDQEDLSNWIERVCDGNVIQPISHTSRVTYLLKGKWAVVRSGMLGDELELYESENGLSRLEGMVPFATCSNITQRFRLEKDYRVLPLQSIKCRAYCVPLEEKGDEGEFLHVVPCSEWSSNFLPDLNAG